MLDGLPPDSSVGNDGVGSPKRPGVFARYRDGLTAIGTLVVVITAIIGGVAYLDKNFPDKSYVDDQTKTIRTQLDGLRSDLKQGLRTMTCLTDARTSIVDAKFQVQASQAAEAHDSDILEELSQKDKLTDIEKSTQKEKTRDRQLQRDLQQALATQLADYNNRVRPGGCDER
jgi:hypothetical protein